MTILVLVFHHSFFIRHPCLPLSNYCAENGSEVHSSVVACFIAILALVGKQLDRVISSALASHKRLNFQVVYH